MRQLRRFEEADSLLTRAIQLLEHPQWLSWRALCRGALGNMPSAERDYRRVIELDPDNGGAMNNLACILLHNGQFDAAHELLAKACLLKPDYMRARANLAPSLCALGRLDAAKDEASAVLARDPPHRVAHLAQGESLQARRPLRLAMINTVLRERTSRMALQTRARAMCTGRSARRP
jgi:Flp pilus assembly protein TadD